MLCSCYMLQKGVKTVSLLLTIGKMAGQLRHDAAHESVVTLNPEHPVFQKNHLFHVANNVNCTGVMLRDEADSERW